jgi:hypothetical protein
MMKSNEIFFMVNKIGVTYYMFCVTEISKIKPTGGSYLITLGQMKMP